VTIAMDTAHHARFWLNCACDWMLYAIAATLISGLLGWLAAPWVSPLHSMRARAAGVSGQQLSERMPVDAVPVEMAELARS
jgi:two-component system heavy metal sensor histidine kinase CusS